MAYNYVRLFVIIFLIINKRITSNIITYTNDENLINHTCFEKIANIIRNLTNLGIINDNLQLNSPIIRYDRNGFNRQTDKLNGDYIIRLNDNETITDSFNLFHLNSRSKFIIIANTTQYIDDIFRILSQHFIYNVIILYDKKIFTYFPYKYENFNVPDIKPYPIIECDRNESNTNIFALFSNNKLPKLWRNTTLKIGWVYLPPYTNCYYNCKLNGIEFDLLKILSEKLMFKISKTAIRYRVWGTKQNGNFTYALKGLHDKTFNIGVGFFHYHESYSSDFDTSFSYMHDYLTWSVPSARPISHAKKILHMCNFYTWFSIFMSIFIVTFATYFIANILQLDNHFKMIYHCFSNVLLTLFSFGPYKFPIAQSGRILFLFWGLYCVILNNVFQGNLINNLNHQIYDKQISNLDDLMTHGIKFILHPELSDGFVIGNSTFDKYVANNFITCIEHEDCVDAVNIGRHATISLRSTVEITETFMPSIYAFKDNIRVDMISMFFNKGFPLFQQIDKYLLWLTSSGIVNHLERTAKIEGSAHNLRKINNVESNIITLKNLYAIFTIYFIGQYLGIVIFCVELIHNKRKRKIIHLEE